MGERGLPHVQSGRALGVDVLDHLILDLPARMQAGRQPTFVSLKERGLGFR